jgi:threonine/homoserine/homoserine lactone efflux protein
MPSSSTYALYLLAALILLAIPGPAVLFVIAQSIGRGRQVGLVSVLGLHAGTLVHVAAAALGISSLLLASATAFSAVRYAGAAYLIALGLRRLLKREATATAVPGSGAGLGRHFRQGFVVNVLNPKTALFFLAFLPQFVDPARGLVPLQVAILGLTFVVLGLATDSVWALASSSAGERLKRSRRWPAVERFATGSVLVGLGVATAVSGPHRPARA